MVLLSRRPEAILIRDMMCDRLNSELLALSKV